MLPFALLIFYPCEFMGCFVHIRADIYQLYFLKVGLEMITDEPTGRKANIGPQELNINTTDCYFLFFFNQTFAG